MPVCDMLWLVDLFITTLRAYQNLSKIVIKRGMCSSMFFIFIFCPNSSPCSTSPSSSLFRFLLALIVLYPLTNSIRLLNALLLVTRELKGLSDK